jgi:hypothetical protein
MPVFHNRVTNLQELGTIIEVIIYPSKPVFDKFKTENKIVPSKKVIALIDTGASISCINSPIAAELNLISRDKQLVGTPNGPALQDTYDVGFHLFSISPLILPVQVLGSNLESQPYAALVGRDILSKCTLIYIGSDNSYSLHI